MRDSRGRHISRLDVGERVCRRAAAEMLAKRLDQRTTAYENKLVGPLRAKKIR